MAKLYGEKLKTLFLMDYLLEQSDKDHPVTVKDMIDFLLLEHGISAARKSIYRDLKILGLRKKSCVNSPDTGVDEFEYGEDEYPSDTETYGLDIVKKKDRYYIDKRYFTLQEVKLLVDMVESSTNIPTDIADQLLEKIRSQVSVHNRKQLERHVDVRNRAKKLNDQFQINADKIFEAINTNNALQFKYFKYNADQERVLRYNGKKYEVSPFSLVWVDQNYYMLGYNHEAEQIRTYRVDRMTAVSVTNVPRIGKSIYEELTGGNLSVFVNKVFHMYLGEERNITMHFSNSLADTVIDRFGDEIMMHKVDEDHFSVTVPIISSPQFYSWLAGFGNRAELVAPSDEREKMRNHLKSALDLY